jgi:hypothetical protein
VPRLASSASVQRRSERGWRRCMWRPLNISV